MRHQLKKKKINIIILSLDGDGKNRKGFSSVAIGHLYFLCPLFFSVGSRSKNSSLCETEDSFLF